MSAVQMQQKKTACSIDQMTYTQAPAVLEKNIFHLFRFTQPEKNYTFSLLIGSLRSYYGNAKDYVD